MKYFVFFVASVYLFSGIAIAGTCGSGGTICCSSVATTQQFECVAPADLKYQFQINRFGFEREDGTIIWVGARLPLMLHLHPQAQQLEHMPQERLFHMERM